MNKDNIIIYVSSRNNYDMLSGEVFKNIDTEGFEFINVDDKSSTEEIEKGKQMCEENDIVFLENKTLNSDKPTPHTATLKINPDLPHHFEDAKALVRNAEESWTFKWRIVVSADVIRGRDQKRQKQVKIKLI